MKTITAEHEIAQDVDFRDYEPVSSLLADARRRQRITNAAITWGNAFMVFKKIESRIGLPDDNDQSQRDAYLAIVRTLRDTGRRILRAVEVAAIDLKQEAEFSTEDLRSCIEELDLDERSAFPQDPAVVEQLNHYFGVK